LYGLYPGFDPFFADEKGKEAARKTLEARGDESTGWSMAWKINFWARLGNGEHAYKLLRDLLRPCMDRNFNYSDGGGSYPNLFCGHPPFQIDGNFGGSAGIAEMLVQSDGYEVKFLPALPKAWKTGSFEGLRVRGGGVASATWENGVLKKSHIEKDFNEK
jgi:alpha-L-fucosidase 2